MILWVDAQFSPKLAAWISDRFGIEASDLKALGLRDAGDFEIFSAARQGGAVVMTKDSDFLNLIDQHGTPPQLLWITCGNTSTEAMQRILESEFPRAQVLLGQGERIVEIRG